VDSRDTYIPSNELTTTTVPVALPFSDPMDTTDNWVIASNNANPAGWAIATSGMAEGSGCLAVAPVGQYAPSTDSYAETAVDLTDTAWPVLSFLDKVDLAAGDYVRLEISADGGPTYFAYGARESSHTDWRRQRIDLSEWKGLANVRLSFRIITDGGAETGNGWFIDDLSVTENPDAASPLVLPLEEDFEGELQANWISAGWHTESDAGAVDGAQVVRSNDGERMGRDTRHWMVLDQPLELAPDSNVQATFWIRGSLTTYSYFRMQYSVNDGDSWADLSDVNLSYTWSSEDFIRMQADLSGLAGSAIRLRFRVHTSSNPLVWIQLDKLTINEMPDAVNLLTAVPDLRSVDLTWEASTLGADFVRYELWRSTSANVSVSNGKKVFETGNVSTVTTTDTGLNIGETYF
jgi:hypothetical protein